MNILFVPTRDPRLKNGGNEQRTNLLWESLKCYGRVYTFLLESQMSYNSKMIKGEHPIYKFRPYKKHNPIWKVVNMVFNRFSLFSIYNRKEIQIDSPEKVFGEIKFDLVVVRYVYPLGYYKYWKIAPTLIDIDDLPIQVYETIRRKKIPFGLKTIGKFVTKLQTRYLVKRSVGGWIVNEEQKKLLNNNYAFLPNIPQVPSSSYKFDNITRSNLFTVGAMGYVPNKEGVTYFLKNIWPLFHQKYPDVQYYIVGNGASETEVELWNNFEGVKYLGFVENLEELYEKSLATVVPVYSGGGTCIKTLEAMAYSRPCLSTKFGARGLARDVIDQKKGVLIFGDTETFIKAYEELQDSYHRKQIETQGRNVISGYYSINVFRKVVEDVLSKIRIEKI